MKTKSIFEDQIRIIKPSSKHQQNAEVPEFVRDKRSESSQQSSIKIMHINRPNQKSPFFHKHSNNKVVVIETLENDPTNNEATKNSYLSCRQKHKKGKSMDLTAQKSLVTDRNPIILDQRLKNTQKASIPSRIVNEFRYKNNISEMKDYNISKRLESTIKKWAELPTSGKKKKKKANFSGESKQLMKELKGIISTQPATKRKTSTGKISDQTFKQKSNSKQIKIIHKSVQFPLEQKQKSHGAKNDLFVSKLLKRGVTMPLSSKLQSLYSNTTSLFSSRTDFCCQTHNYAISTQQSVNEIFEIRQFQSLALNQGKSSSIGLKKLSGGSSMNKFGQSAERQKTTQDLINNFIKMINFEGKSITMSNISKEIEKSMDFLNISKDLANKTQKHPYNKQALATPLRSQQMYDSFQDISNKTDQQSVFKQEIQIQRLNEIIGIIKQKEVLSHQQKYIILHKMKELMSESKGQCIPFLGRADTTSYVLQRQTKPLIASHEESNINLQILEKILRDRQHYLIECREKEIKRIQTMQDQSQQQFQRQKQIIVKRYQHQIKEVVHTRLQLWKGLNFTDKLAMNGRGQQRKEMMRCLSEKYLMHSKSIIMASKKQQNNSDNNQNSQTSNKDGEIGKAIECIKQSEILQNKVTQFLNQTPQNVENQPQPILSQSNQVFHEQKDTQKSFRSVLRGVSFLKHSLIDQDEDIVTPHQNQPVFEQTQPNADTLVSKTERTVEEINRNYPFHHLGKRTVSIEQDDTPIKSPFDNLTLQGKEDICQFVFIDLCLEVTEDYSRNSPMIHHIFNFIKKMKEQSKRPKGFKTNSTAIKEYLNHLISFIKSKQTLMEQIHSNLDEPIGPSALQILKFLHVPDEHSPPQDEPEENLNILNPLIFEQFQEIFIKTYQFQKYYEEEEKQKKRILFLKNALHVHNKAIFDTLNERLDIQRPFGLWGKPFSWKKIPKFHHDRNPLSKNDLVYSSAQRVIQFGSYLCGFMVDKQDCSFRDNPNVTESYIEQIRVDRLTRMLAEQLQEDEEKMLFIDDEQTEFQVQISETIWQKLLLQFCKEMP